MKTIKHVIVTAALSAVAVACSSSTSGGTTAAPQTLQGDWYYTDPETSAVEAIGFELFEPGSLYQGTYVYQYFVVAPNDYVDIEQEIGTIEFDANTVTLMPNQSTCSGAHPDKTYLYSFSLGNLILSSSSSAVSYSPNAPSSIQNRYADYGCFSSSGVFTPAPIAPVNQSN